MVGQRTLYNISTDLIAVFMPFADLLLLLNPHLYLTSC